MNAKKIMGAVLVALLAVTAFAGVAAADPVDKGIVYIGQKGISDSALLDQTLYNGAYSITISSDGKVTGDNVEGTYANADVSVYVSKPTAKYNLVGTIDMDTPATTDDVSYIVANGGKVYLKSSLVFNQAATADVGIAGFLVKDPTGLIGKYDVSYVDGKNLTARAGTYSIQAIFNSGDFITGFDEKGLIDEKAFTFTVVDESDATISASVDTVYNGEYVLFTIEGTIGEEYFLELIGFALTGVDQIVTLTPETAMDTEDGKVYSFVMPNSGIVTLQFKAAAPSDKDEASVKLSFEDKEIDEVEIAISAAELTATLGAASYYIGDEIEISGTSTSELTALSFTITGTNFKETLLEFSDDDEKTEFGKTWKAALKTDGVTEEDDGKKGLDVASYTIKIYQANYASQDELETAIAGENGAKPVKTVVVKLNQPFISIIEAPEVVTQGTEAKFIINAEATEHIRYYIFGTNFFFASENVKNDKGIANQFTAKLSKLQTKAENMSTGQYFMVIQHPMYDKQFNIAADNDAFYLNTSVTADEDNGQLLFNVNKRQTANAAQALCDALDSQNIDDMYVKYSFFVVGEDESFTISDIPKEIAKGTTLVISGVDTANADATVIVEMVSTAFAAVPKETVGSAAFVAVTTEVAEDGTWEVTLDTSELAIDEYALTVKIAEDVKKNVNINVVEAADEPVTPPTDEPGQDEPGQDEPVAPETPGFGALAALAGLGAVAVLLLRRE